MVVEDSIRIIINNNIRTDICPCCKSTSLSPIGEIKYAKNTTYSSSQISLTEIPELWSCNECQSCFTQNRVSEIDSISLYSLGDSWSSDSFTKIKTKETVDLIDSLIKPGCKILDIGCANGAMLDYAKDRGAVTYGLEYSKSNIDELRNKQHTAYSDWSQVNESFDIITAFDVIEHLYNLDSFLDLCRNHLSNDGVIVLLTGDINSWSARRGRNFWWYVKYSEHILFPSLDYLSSLQGFKVVNSIKTSPNRLDIYSPIINFFWNLKTMFSTLRLKNFVPTIFFPPDHFIVVLKKSDQ